MSTFELECAHCDRPLEVPEVVYEDAVFTCPDCEGENTLNVGEGIDPDVEGDVAFDTYFANCDDMACPACAWAKRREEEGRAA